MDAFALVVAIAGVVAGAVASVVAFGVGSILTPLLGITLGLKLAVAAASIPHAIATAVRLWMVRASVHRRVLLTFGVSSAIGGLAGAALQTVASSPALAAVFAILLIFAGLGALTGYADRMRLGRRGAVIGGVLSGFLGGLVGNQGGIRSAAMLGFDVPKEAFVATATAIALIVDAVRMPIYVATQGRQLAEHMDLIAVAAVAVVAGTFIGTWTLRRIPERAFRRTVGAILVVLGIFTILSAR